MTSTTPAAGRARPRRVLWARMREVDRFARLHFLFFSAYLPLLGASSVRPQLGGGRLAALLGVGLCFHLYSYILNDVLDLPIDRTQPLRQADPLVRGAIRPGLALLVALIQIPLTVPVTLRLGGNRWAYATLGVGFGLMAVYNRWGKRCPVPPLTDLVQGLAWGSLALYAALAIGGAPNLLTWVVVAYAAGFILLINGIHGGLRDLENDLASGARNTAIFLGARPGLEGEVQVPPGVRVFAHGVFGGLVAAGLLPLLRNDFGYGPATRIVMLAVGTGAFLLALRLLGVVVRPGRALWDFAFRVQLLIMVMALPAIFAPYLSAATLLTIVVFLAVSLFANDWTYRVARWLWQRLRSAPRPESDRSLDAELAGTDP